MMSDDLTITRVWEIATPLAAEEGMEIVDIELHRGGRGGGRLLRLYLDKEGGPTLDDLARVSRQLSERLDSEDAVEGRYTLEVSSPGINRPLKKPEHFAGFIGKKVRVRAREIIEGRRSFQGLLKELRENEIVVLQEGVEFHIPFSAIEKANYEHDWSART
jgi:ribosome maturation factor RimP